MSHSSNEFEEADWASKYDYWDSDSELHDNQIFQNAINLLTNAKGNEEERIGILKILLSEFGKTQTALRIQQKKNLDIRKELNDLRNFFNEIYDISPVGHITLDENLKIQESNLTFSQLLGLDPEDMAERLLTDLIYRPDTEVFHNFVNELLKNQVAHSYDIRIINGFGSITWLRLDGRRIIETNDARSIRITAIDISDLKRIEESLRLEEAKWRNLFDILPVGVSIYSPEKGVSDFNQALTNILDLTKNGLHKGKYQSRRYFRADGSPMSAYEFPSVRAAKENKSIKNVIIQVEKENGDIVWTEVSAAPLPLQRGAVVITQDITQRIQQETEIRTSNQRFRSLFENAPISIVLIDMENVTIVDVNQEFEEIFGFSREEIYGKSPFDIGFDIGEEAVQKVGKKLEEEGLAVDRVIELRTKSGERRVFSVTLKTLLIEGKKLLLVMALDITERMRIERELRERQHFISSVVDTLPAMVYVFDFRNKSNIYVNEGMKAILDYSPQDVQQMGEELIGTFIHPDDLPDYLAFQERIKSAKDGEVLENEYRSRHRNGDWRTLHTYETPFMRDENSNVAQKMGIAVDVSALKENERLIQSQIEQIKDMSRHLAEVEEMEKRMLARELHDSLGNDLTALGLHFENLVRELSQNLKKDFSLPIEDVRTLLNSSKAKIRDLMMDLHPAILEDRGLAAALKWYGELCAARGGFDFHLKGKELKPPLPLEKATSVFRAAQEALNNITKHAIAENVSIEIRKDRYNVKYIIHDDGKGFHPEKVGGASSLGGWGLSIMKERLAAIGGYLNIVSSPGEGTAVTIKVKRPREEGQK